MRTSRAEVWDRYWRRRISEIQEQYYFGSGFRRCHILPRLQEMLGPRMRRVLFAGSGHWLDPYYYAHLGYQVTAVDISRVAMDWVRAAGEKRDIATWFYEVQYDSFEADGIVWVRMDVARSREAAALHHVPGGSARCIAADLLEYEPDEPFDAIRVCRTIGNLPDEEQHALARRFHQWLSPGGVCWAASQGGHPDRERIGRTLGAFERAGFTIYLADWYHWLREAPVRGRYEASPEDREKCRLESRERREREEREQLSRLAAGEKLAVCIHEGDIFRGW